MASRFSTMDRWRAEALKEFLETKESGPVLWIRRELGWSQATLDRAVECIMEGDWQLHCSWDSNAN